MTTRLRVVVTPRSSRELIVGWRDAELWVKVTAPPDDGKANAAVCSLLADTIGVPKGSVRVLRGHSSRHKLIELEGVDSEAVRKAFGAPVTPDP